MKLTIVKPHKGNTWAVELDDSGELIFLHVSVVEKLGLKAGMELTPEEWETVQETELARKAYQYACYLLDSRGYSYQELFRKLEPKYPEAVCYGVMDRLVAYGQINDRAYAEQLAHHYVAHKQFGYRRVWQELYRKGLLEQQIADALEPYADQMEENLRELIARKYSTYFENPEDRRMLEKGKGALVRRGYSFSQIHQALEEFWEEDD